MRNIVTLLTILRDEGTDKIGVWYITGLCSCIDEIHQREHISDEQASILHIYLRKNRPLIGWIRYWWMYIYHEKYDGLYWWTRGAKAPRLRWLNRRIRIERMKMKIKKFFRYVFRR